MPIEFVTPAAVADTRMFFAKALERPALSTRTELPLLDKNGAEHQFEVVATNLLHIPSISGVVVNLRDITERKQMMARLKLLSETDLLTGALNRRGFAQTATVEFERMRRRGGPVVVAMIDIDHFKSINDTYGHAGGDKALIAVAECCRQHIRSADLFARVGGEEFVILLADSDVQAAENAVDRLRLAIAGTRIPTIDARVTASFGIAAVDPARRDLEGAMRRADEALYAAKSAGRNCIRMVSDVFEPYD
jgi:diguanylate cyclase (GGDEF)-like protein